MPKRDLWVDYAKAIGIILVVYGHVAHGLFKAGIWEGDTFYHLVDSVIYTFHMPLFFSLSGLFFKTTLLKEGKGLFILKNCLHSIIAHLIRNTIIGKVRKVVERLLEMNNPVKKPDPGGSADPMLVAF
jgi:uncharacterized membrane protein YcfT